MLTVDKSSIVRWWRLPDAGAPCHDPVLMVAASAVLNSSACTHNCLHSFARDVRATSCCTKDAYQWTVSSSFPLGVNLSVDFTAGFSLPCSLSVVMTIIIRPFKSTYHCINEVTLACFSQLRRCDPQPCVLPWADDRQRPQLLAEAPSPFKARVVCVDVSPDGRLLLAGDQSGAVIAFKVPVNGLLTPKSAFGTGMPGLSVGSRVKEDQDQGQMSG